MCRYERVAARLVTSFLLLQPGRSFVVACPSQRVPDKHSLPQSGMARRTRATWSQGSRLDFGPFWWNFSVPQLRTRVEWPVSPLSKPSQLWSGLRLIRH